MPNCKQGKVRNPRTGRCIKVGGAVYKKVFGNAAAAAPAAAAPQGRCTAQQRQKCSQKGMVCNPRTGRCIKVGGAVYKKVFAAGPAAAGPAAAGPAGSAECDSEMPVTGLLHRVIRNSVPRLKTILNSGRLMVRPPNKNWGAAAPGVYTALLTECLWENIQNGEDLSILPYGGDARISLVFSKALIYDLPYYINEFWSYGAKDDDTIYKNIQNPNSEVKDGVDKFLTEKYNCQDPMPLRMEVIFTQDVPLHYLQEIWIKRDVDYNSLKNDTDIPKKYRNLMIKTSQVQCKNYNKYCRGKRNIVTVGSCQSNSDYVMEI